MTAKRDEVRLIRSFGWIRACSRCRSKIGTGALVDGAMLAVASEPCRDVGETASQMPISIPAAMSRISPVQRRRLRPRRVSRWSRR